VYFLNGNRQKGKERDVNRHFRLYEKEKGCLHTKKSAEDSKKEGRTLQNCPRQKGRKKEIKRVFAFQLEKKKGKKEGKVAQRFELRKGGGGGGQWIQSESH